MAEQRLIDANALINRIVFHTDWTTDEKEAFEDEINAEPTIEERKTGKWICWYEEIKSDTCTEYIPHCKCPKCGTEYDPHSAKFINFCPRCGMRLVQGGEDNAMD